MSLENRPRSLADVLIREFDRALRTVAAANVAARPTPAGPAAETVTDAAARRHAAGLMRVNHAGEIAAIMKEYYQLGFGRRPEHLVQYRSKVPLRYSWFSHQHYGDEAASERRRTGWRWHARSRSFPRSG